MSKLSDELYKEHGELFGISKSIEEQEEGITNIIFYIGLFLHGILSWFSIFETIKWYYNYKKDEKNI